MNSLKFTKEHIKWTLEGRRLSSLFVRLSEESVGYDWDKSKNKYVPNGNVYGAKMFSLYCNWKETVWGKNANGDPVAREEWRTNHLLNLSTDFEKANEKAKKLCKELKVSKVLFLTDEPVYQNPYKFRTPEELKAEKLWESIKDEIFKLRSLKSRVQKHSFKIAKLRERRLSPSNFVGEVGDKTVFDLTLKFKADFQNYFYGRPVTSWLNNLVDAQGNVFVYWGKCLGNKGDNIKMKATIKEHKVYKGIKQTVVNRPKILEGVN
tara:strand:- start:36 stop:827 length:792 start_codon:yes stop_codon:yes gene_type:complete